MQERWRLGRRKAAGYLWLALWAVVLYTVASPWTSLGGVVDERLRWLERVVLVTAPPIGFTIGQFARDAAVRDSRWTHLRLLRVLLYPLGLLTAGSLTLLLATGQRDPVGVITSAFLAYWAGLDAAFGAVPLLWGKSYRFDRPLDPE